MRYFMETRWGGSIRDPSAAQMKEALAELDVDDPEHPDIWLTVEDGLTLSAHQSGKVVLENVENDEEPRHISFLTREETLRLWQDLIEGKVATIESLPWKSGYGPL